MLLRIYFTEFTLDYVKEHGLKQPLRFTETEHLGMVVPRGSFTVADVMYA